MKTLPGTRMLPASELKEGDILLKDDGSYYATVAEKYFDIDGLWLDDGYNMGYVSENTQYLIEWNEE
jgi:hypothetical protein